MQQIYAITGSTGFLGKHFVTNFAKRFPHAKVALLLNRTEPAFIPEGWKTCLAPLDDEEALGQALFGVTTLVHLAGLSHADSKEEYWSVNALGTQNLVKAAQKNNVQKIVYVSTRAIGDECGDYAKSKRAGELCVAESKIPFVIVRLSEIYGAGSHEGINNLIGLVRKVPVVPYPSGVSPLAPLFLDDAIEGIVACLERDDNIYNGTYMLAGPSSYTFLELISVISRVLKLKRFALPLPLILFRVLTILSRKMHRPVLRYDQLARMVCLKDDDINRARTDLNFNPRSFEDGLKKLIY